AGAASGPGLVAAFTGPKGGTGKTQVALNLALATAATRNRPVLIVQLDPLCRHEHSFFLNLKAPTAVELAQFLQGAGTQSTSTMAKLLKGKIPQSQFGVATLPLAKRRSEAAKLHPEMLMPLLAALSETYDLFLDVDTFFPMQVMAFDLADVV